MSMSIKHLIRMRKIFTQKSYNFSTLDIKTEQYLLKDVADMNSSNKSGFHIKLFQIQLYLLRSGNEPFSIINKFFVISFPC